MNNNTDIIDYGVDKTETVLCLVFRDETKQYFNSRFSRHLQTLAIIIQTQFHQLGIEVPEGTLESALNIICTANNIERGGERE